ncbi:MAG: hypothetical protein JXA30_21470 [Deltaproteobacteria bacterium]|nr:hypothetical protein [Deltaproteobacteria bacterium]
MNASSKRLKLTYVVVVALAIGTGLLLRRHVLTDIGLGSDDYMQHAMLDGVYPAKRSAFDLFKFADGSAEERQELMNFGTIPWWNHPGFRLAMMRPLSSALTYLDYALFGRNQVAFHIHSMLWWALFIVSTALLFIELLPIRIAMIAVALFAVEQGHGLPTLWLANRNALISLTFGTVGLWSHIRWRRGGPRRFWLLSVVVFSLALLAGEWAFASFAYLFAFELVAGEGPLRSRMKALASAAVLASGFLVAQGLLGYSALYSNIYVNPITEPVEYLIQALQRIPVMFAEIVFGLPALWYQEGTPWRSFVLSLDIFTPEIWRKLPSWQFWHISIGVVAGIIAFFVIRWGLRAGKSELRKELGWLLLGAFFSLLPMVASFPATRLVLPAAIGVSAVWATVILYGYDVLLSSIKRNSFRPSLKAILVLAGVGYTQVWQASTYDLWEVGAYSYFYESVRQWILQADVDQTRVKDQHIFMINGTEHTNVFFAPFVWNYHGYRVPRSCRILSAAPHAHDIERTGENELRYTVLAGVLLDSPMEQLYRVDKYPYALGDSVELDEFRVTITELQRGKPFRFRFTFKKPLESPSYLFLYSAGTGLRRFALPRVGETYRVRLAVFPSLVLLQRR